MMKMLFLFLFLWPATIPSVTSYQDQDTRSFLEQLRPVIAGIQHFQSKRPHRLKYMNDSLQKMSQAAALILEGSGSAEPHDLLDQSMRSYKANCGAYLLKAVLYEAMGDLRSSTEWMEKFLLRSQTYSEFEEVWISQRGFHKVRRLVYQTLESRGVSFEGREKSIQSKNPLMRMLNEFQQMRGGDEFMNILFFSVIIVGGILLLVSNMIGLNFHHPVLRVFVPMYLLVWVSYGLWFYDMLQGLPFGWQRGPTVWTLLIGSLTLLVSNEVYRYVRQRHQPVGEGEKRCPRCREVLSALIMECPYCGTKLPSPDTE